MRPFLYFIADRQTLKAEDAAKLGLAYALEGSIDCRPVPGRGPGGKQGVVCAQAECYELGELGFFETRQTWRQIPKSQESGVSSQGPEIWVGHANGELPGPEDLVRKKPLTGWQLELGDGRQWMVPMARSYSEHETEEDLELRYTVLLPQRLDVAADGRWVRTGVSPRYAALWELAEAWLRVNSATGTPEDLARFDDQGQIDGAVLCLQANYRLGRIEAAMLGLFQDDTLVVEVLDRLIDRPTLEAFTKKKAARMAAKAATPPAGSNSSAGPAAETPVTGPPAPT